MYPRLERFLMGSKFACVEAEVSDAGIVYHFIILQRKNGLVSTIELQHSVQSVPELLNWVDKKTPVVLIISGKGVINRKIAIGEEVSDESVIRMILSNAVPEELCISRYKLDADSALVALSRRDQVRTIVTRMKRLSVVAVLLGSGSVAYVADLVGEINEQLSFGNHALHFADGKIQNVSYSISKEKHQVQIDDDFIPGQNLLSFAGAMAGLSNTGFIPGEISESAAMRKNFIRMKRYGVSVKTSFMLVFIALLANFLIFSHLRDLRAELDSGSSVRENNSSLVIELREKVAREQSMLDNNGMGRLTSLSWLADRIAQSVPDDVVLSQLDIAPANTFNREDTIAFDSDRIIISGSCKESTSLDTWLNRLEESEWIESVIITNYNDAGTVKNRSDETSRGNFGLELICR